MAIAYYVTSGSSAAYRWRGPQDATQGRSSWTTAADKVSVSVPYTGVYEKLESSIPVVGQILAGVKWRGNALCIDGYTLAPQGESPAGLLTVSASIPISAQLSGNFAPLGESVLELDWTELVKNITSHPKCGKLNFTSAATKSLDNWQELQTGDYVQNDSNGWTYDQYLQIRAAGTDSYTVPAPVVSRTTYYMCNPPGVGAAVFTLQDPPSDAGAPSGYYWLKTADRLIKEGGKRTRSEQWTGANEGEEISHLIYH